MKPLLPALLTSGPHLMNSPSNIKDDWALKITRNKFCYSFESLSIYLSFLNSHYCCTSGPWCNIQSQMVCLCVSFSLPAPSWSHVLCQLQQCLLTRKSLKGKVSIMWVHGSRLFSERRVWMWGASGVALPIRDLRQPTQNNMYFASLARKMRTA